MEWSKESFEQEISSCAFFRNNAYEAVGTEVKDPGTWLERYMVRLENLSVDRAIEVIFLPSNISEKPALFKVDLVKISVDDGFDLVEYIKQYHDMDIDSNIFHYNNYSGTFEQRVHFFRASLVQLFETYSMPILKGIEWPNVEFNWSGLK